MSLVSIVAILMEYDVALWAKEAVLVCSQRNGKSTGLTTKLLNSKLLWGKVRRGAEWLTDDAGDAGGR